MAKTVFQLSLVASLLTQKIKLALENSLRARIASFLNAIFHEVCTIVVKSKRKKLLEE